MLADRKREAKLIRIISLLLNGEREARIIAAVFSPVCQTRIPSYYAAKVEAKRTIRRKETMISRQSKYPLFLSLLNE